MIKDTLCTSGPCAWLSPNMASVDYTTIAEIDFSIPIAVRRAIMENHTATVFTGILRLSPLILSCLHLPKMN